MSDYDMRGNAIKEPDVGFVGKADTMIKPPTVEKQSPTSDFVHAPPTPNPGYGFKRSQDGVIGGAIKAVDKFGSDLGSKLLDQKITNQNVAEKSLNNAGEWAFGTRGRNIGTNIVNAEDATGSAVTGIAPLRPVNQMKPVEPTVSSTPASLRPANQMKPVEPTVSSTPVSNGVIGGNLLNKNNLAPGQGYVKNSATGEETLYDTKGNQVKKYDTSGNEQKMGGSFITVPAASLADDSKLNAIQNVNAAVKRGDITANEGLQIMDNFNAEVQQNTAQDTAGKVAQLQNKQAQTQLDQTSDNPEVRKAVQTPAEVFKTNVANLKNNLLSDDPQVRKAASDKMKEFYSAIPEKDYNDNVFNVDDVASLGITNKAEAANLQRLKKGVVKEMTDDMRKNPDKIDEILQNFSNSVSANPDVINKVFGFTQE